MRIVTLIENNTRDERFVSEHGLSVYIETSNHKLIVDTGATGAFIQNAVELGIDLTKVDTLILSHGHYDHSGGILAFAKINPDAKIYMQRKAADDYYHGERYIGIDKEILKLKNVHLLDGDYKLDDELILFTNVTGRKYFAPDNLTLTKKVDCYDSRDELEENENCVDTDENSVEIDCINENSTDIESIGLNCKKIDIQDDFSHEHYLVIRDDKERILVSGCAHNGIVNILDKYNELYNELPTRVISGFHLRKKTEYTEEDIEQMKDIANELKKMDIIFYTGHCTGQFAFDVMKEIMGEQLVQIFSGESVM